MWTLKSSAQSTKNKNRLVFSFWLDGFKWPTSLQNMGYHDQLCSCQNKYSCRVCNWVTPTQWHQDSGVWLWASSDRVGFTAESKWWHVVPTRRQPDGDAFYDKQTLDLMSLTFSEACSSYGITVQMLCCSQDSGRMKRSTFVSMKSATYRFLSGLRIRTGQMKWKVHS